ncbi:MAG: sugar transporter [Deltaproteobacteria bacterium CG23_combo_of_CG06-09_8_20_14_all_60_8]|nr:MAG: sugar transporter [Deltaproteobacteria bacterium CG23_combo_of_CG06-09_8_20_14_all_60_8]
MRVIIASGGSSNLRGAGGTLLKLVVLVLFALVLCAPLVSADAGADQPGAVGADYILGPGDILDISAWQNPALAKLVTVLPDGKISFPLIGEVMAGGKTVAQLKGELEEKIIRYVPDPTLSVIVHQVNSMMVYVIGKVNQPGRHLLNANINVLQVLAMAGGFNPFANRGKVKIFRQQGGDTVIFPFDYDEVADGKKLDTNITLKRGDVIVVP